MSKRTITAHFTAPEEWAAEVIRDKDQIARRIVRLTEIARPVHAGAVTRVDVVGSAIVEGRVSRLVAYCGELWGVRVRDEEVQQRATKLITQLERRLQAAGSEIRAGLWEDQ